MNAFAALLSELERARSTRRKLALLRAYFTAAPAGDAAWALHLLTGRRPRRVVSGPELRHWLGAETGLPAEVIEATYAHVGDLAETVALVLGPQKRAPATAPTQESLQSLLEEIIEPLRGAPAPVRQATITALWARYPGQTRLWLNKLLTGGLRVGVGEGLTLRALGQAFGLDPEVLQHRWMTPKSPSAAAFRALVDPDGETLSWAAPYPFCLAQGLKLDAPPADPTTLLAEWKWDGVRCQLVRRDGQTALWSRGRERLEDRFPELLASAESLADGTVLDGELLVWEGDHPGSFANLSRRLQRKKATPALQRSLPCRFLAYDLLEQGGEDLRSRPLHTRRARLEALLTPAKGTLHLSPALSAASWPALTTLRQSARERGAEGLMLKHRNAPYAQGRKSDCWWKWKLDPETVDAVLLYAQPGHGRRANLYTDFTFAVWDGPNLVPLAKAYSGLDEPTLERLDRWIRKNTTERFGPVRAVTPTLVFELAFDSAHAAPRRKAGLALRFPRIHRWREDLAAEDADQLALVRARVLPHG